MTDDKRSKKKDDSLDFILKYQCSDKNLQLFTRAMMKTAADNNMHAPSELSKIQITHSPKWFDKSMSRMLKDYKIHLCKNVCTKVQKLKLGRFMVL
jgi:hypothetical protein